MVNELSGDKLWVILGFPCILIRLERLSGDYGVFIVISVPAGTLVLAGMLCDGNQRSR